MVTVNEAVGKAPSGVLSSSKGWQAAKAASRASDKNRAIVFISSWGFELVRPVRRPVRFVVWVAIGAWGFGSP